MTNEMTIFDLGMHHDMSLGDWRVLRVPGGWIYSHTDYNIVTYDREVGTQNIMDTHSIFVPYSDAVKRELLEEVVHG